MGGGVAQRLGSGAIRRHLRQRNQDRWGGGFLVVRSNLSAPRAARFCIDRLEAALERIAAEGPGEGVSVPAAKALAARLRLGTADAAIKAGLHEYLLEIQEDCARISDEVFAGYLRFE